MDLKNSMLLANLMSQKQNIMYATIKGSLTDTDGIISGFVNTGENYLQVNNMDSLALVDSWEIVLKLENVSGSYAIGSNLERIITASLSTGKLYLSSNGSSWNIANGVGSGSVPANSYIRVKFTGTQYTFDYSSDKVTWTNCATVTSSTKITSLLSYLKIGAWWTGSSYTTNFSGTINLDKSSIKINSTKYNLQAVVGYTVVGSPTISDGVVSGFSASDYLTLQQQFQPADKNWEIVIKTEITQLNVTQTIIGSSTNTRNTQLTIRDTNTIRLYRTINGISDSVTNSTLTIDSLGVYYFKISFNGMQYKVSVSQDGNNYIDYIVSTSSTPIYNNSPALSFAHNGRSTSEFFRGSIDMNKTYIKINNKLWFNGQER